MKRVGVVVLTTVLMSVFLLTGIVLAKDARGSRILWEHAGELEAAIGYKENIGVAGVLSGVSNNHIVVGGGANFPDGGPLVGGAKKSYPDLYVFKVGKGRLIQTDHSKMPFEIAYGISVTAPEGLYYIGGSPEENGAKTISLLTVDERGKVQVKQIGTLPFSIQNGVGAFYNGALYIGAGKQDGKLSNAFYRYDLKTQQLTQLPEFLGEAREQSVSQVLNGKWYVFSGGSSIAYTDGYEYDFVKQVWSKAASVNDNGKEISLLGANSVKLNADEMLVIGGFNKTIYDNAVANLTTLKGEALAKFKDGYFNADPVDFHWNKKVLIYQASTNTWRSVGQIPFDAPCGEGLVLTGKHIVSINGEIKPGVRSKHLYLGTFLL